MARQAGPVYIHGTIEDLTFYPMEGGWYVRRKSSLTGKRVKKDPKFRRTMQNAERLKRGSQLASQVYRSLPKAKQVYTLYKQLKRMAVLALKAGRSEAEVVTLLNRHLEENNNKAKSKRTRVKVGSRVVKPLFRTTALRAGRKRLLQTNKCLRRYQRESELAVQRE